MAMIAVASLGTQLALPWRHERPNVGRVPDRFGFVYLHSVANPWQRPCPHSAHGCCCDGGCVFLVSYTQFLPSAVSPVLESHRSYECLVAYAGCHIWRAPILASKSL